MLILKHYQQQALDKLAAYLEQTRLTNNPSQSFAAFQEAPGFSNQYKILEGLEGVPYVCLRLPTGGGKTLLSAHTVSVTAKSYLENDYPLVLWLTPTDIIRNQTLETLKNPRHPNREVLDDTFNGRVRVFDITDFTQLRPSDIGNSVGVFVATFASLRVNRTDGRKVYAHHEELEPHFSHIPKTYDFFERNENGGVKFSFVNLLAYYRPLVIIDEAHNHSSELSIEVLQRIRPSAIVEFTATPARNSNVLYRVTASELKAEEMIKLPVVLTEHSSWEDTITYAIQNRQRLDILARNEEQYIRPIILFQAENKDKEITVDKIRNYLIEQENIPPEEIAVATGEQRELDGVNLFDPACPVKYVITVQALKEGWDCSFAYILCSMARVQSSKDAEQLLGRVLRMPYAKRRKEPDLNRAYAHVAITSWTEAVSHIHDNLVSMGFEQVEADVNILYQPSLQFGGEQQKYEGPEQIDIYTSEAPNVSDLNLILQSEATIKRTEDGGYKTTFVVRSRKDLDELENNISRIYTMEQDQTKLADVINQKKRKGRPLSPSEKGEILVIPQLCLDFGDGYCEIADREAFLPDGWNILDFPVELEGFVVNQDTRSFEIDIQGTKVYERPLQNMELDLTGAVLNWTETDLIIWFDRKLHQEDIVHTQLTEFIRRHLRYLQERKGVNFAELVRLRFILEKRLREKINNCRDAAYKKAVQFVLFEQPQTARVSPDITMVFKDCYPANDFYRGSFKFAKHFFPTIGAFDTDEELDCAKAFEMQPRVKTWVRNISRQPQYSFWLPTSKDRFYPDFVVQLTDGRILVVEYKGDYLVTNEETQEKDMVGVLWAKQSNGKCLFLMATKIDKNGRDVYQQIENIILMN